MKKAMTACTLAALFLVFAAAGVWAAGDQLYPLTPKRLDIRNGIPQQDPNYPVTHVDEVAEYYLGSGAADDTFFIVFEPPAACSVKYVEIQWFDAGNVTAFAAWFNHAALPPPPDCTMGTAPNRGTSPESPIASWIAGPVPNTAAGTQRWERLDLGANGEFVVGNPTTLQPELFGVGFVKLAEEPHPLADGMNAKGIRKTYTWFGGPWMASYDHPWGAYSGNLVSGTVIEVMMKVWVSYPWGMPILISNLYQHNNTYNTSNPYNITVDLVDDGPGITAADSVYLVYKVDGGAANWMMLTETAPGSGTYQANIPGQAAGSQIIYYVYTRDDVGLRNTSVPKLFDIVAPAHPDADILFVTSNVSGRFSAYNQVLFNNNIWYERWDVGDNMGIDNSVINYGWSAIVVVAWGVAPDVLPALNEATPFRTFLTGGGNLALIDQDYFYGNTLPDSGNFVAGDFAYDFFGLSQYWNDPNVGGTSIADCTYYGETGDPISGQFIDPNYYETYFDTSGIHEDQQWADFFTVSTADEIFYGLSDARVYGSKYASNFKTVFLSFMAEAACEYDTVSTSWYYGGLVPNQDFTDLLLNIINWFNPDLVNPKGGLTPADYSLSQNYPNPFNPVTSISFVLGKAGEVSLKVYNLMGQEVAALVEGRMSAGAHVVDFDAAELASGIYYYKLTSGDFEETQKMVLLK